MKVYGKHQMKSLKFVISAFDSNDISSYCQCIYWPLGTERDEGELWLVTCI